MNHRHPTGRSWCEKMTEATGAKAPPTGRLLVGFRGGSTCCCSSLVAPTTPILQISPYEASDWPALRVLRERCYAPEEPSHYMTITYGLGTGVQGAGCSRATR